MSFHTIFMTIVMGGMITITKDHMIMVVEFCNIKFNSSRGTHPTIEIQNFKYKL